MKLYSMIDLTLAPASSLWAKNSKKFLVQSVLLKKFRNVSFSCSQNSYCTFSILEHCEVATYAGGLDQGLNISTTETVLSVLAVPPKLFCFQVDRGRLRH